MELIKSEMTPRERLGLYASGQLVDRIPVSLTAGETLPLLYGIDICDYYFSVENMVMVESNLARDFGADNMGMGIGLRTLAEALGTKLRYSKNNVSVIETPIIKDYSQLDNMKAINIERDGRFPIMIEAFQRLISTYQKERIISTGMAGPFTTAISLCGTEKFLKDSVRKKDDIHRLLSYSTKCVIECAKQLNEKLGISISLSEPMASGDLISRKQFKELVKPYLKETVDAFGKFQKSTSIHICGRTKDRWNEICETGIHTFSVDNCESMKELKDKIGDKVGIIGNVSPVDILLNGTPEEVEIEVKKCILEAADSPKGFVLCPGCTTPIGTPKDNIITLINTATVYGSGAKKGCMPEGMKKLF